MNILLDTSIIIEFLRNNPSVITNLEKTFQRKTNIFISILTIYEVKRGFLIRPASRKQELFEEFTKLCKIQNLSDKSVELASHIYAHLHTKGCLIGEIDTLIASQGLELNALLVTTNLKHFQNIDKLNCKNWNN